jgi:hypothetical protein
LQKKYYRARESKIFENISGEAYLGTEYLLAASDLYIKSIHLQNYLAVKVIIEKSLRLYLHRYIYIYTYILHNIARLVRKIELRQQ